MDTEVAKLYGRDGILYLYYPWSDVIDIFNALVRFSDEADFLKFGHEFKYKGERWQIYGNDMDILFIKNLETGENYTSPDCYLREEWEGRLENLQFICDMDMDKDNLTK